MPSEIKIANKKIELIPLTNLEFDPSNPRFGRSIDVPRTQTEILDYIVEEYGIDDVLSSISVNGYFTAEPLIAREKEGNTNLVVVEGNRRLAACLILMGDERAKNQRRRTKLFSQTMKEYNREPFDSVPVIKFGLHEDEKDLLSYLGVRHIASSLSWDSYAKAAWTARVVEESQLSLNEIALMIGDQHKTIKKLLEAYYFINQLIDERKFIPENSFRKGRGSRADFPFSWIYTVFGYPTAREFVGLPEIPSPKPIPPSKIDNANLLVLSMFGDQTAGIQPAIDDSRKIGNLASILDNPEKVELLKKRKNIYEIEFETKPVESKLQEGLFDCKDILGKILSAIAATPPSDKDASKTIPLAKEVRNLSTYILSKLMAIQVGDGNIDGMGS